MPPKKILPDAKRQAEIIAELRRDREIRQKSYREQALKILPHICARCGREFSGKRLRELTVHHKDHNYKNNSPDGKNWELLCLYCHDNEHEKNRLAGHYQDAVADSQKQPPSVFQPFEKLDTILKSKEKPPEPEGKNNN